MKTLNPFIEESELIQISGRLQNYPYEGSISGTSTTFATIAPKILANQRNITDKKDCQRMHYMLSLKTNNGMTSEGCQLPSVRVDQAELFSNCVVNYC